MLQVLRAIIGFVILTPIPNPNSGMGVLHLLLCSTSGRSLRCYSLKDVIGLFDLAKLFRRLGVALIDIGVILER
jgi:hypothetical protein